MSPSDSAEADQLREHQAELDKKLAATPTQRDTTRRLKTDYFGTPEHKALGDLLTAMLKGGNPLAKPPADASHVLFKLTGDPAQFLDGALELTKLVPVSAGADWLSAYSDTVDDLIHSGVLERDYNVSTQSTLRYGDILALAGDYFADPEQLRADLTPETAAEIRRVKPDAKGAGWVTFTRPLEYAVLALQNAPHFAPWNWYRYARHHAEALLLALDRRMEEALIRNAFADHFVTDAFASGHMRTPRTNIGPLDSLHMHDEDNTHGLWVRNLDGYVWRAYGDGSLGTNPVHLAMTAIVVARSIKRVLTAYRLEGAPAEALRTLANKALQVVPAKLLQEPTRDPSALPEVLDDAGVDLPSIRRWLPTPLVGQAVPGGRELLCNYPPMFNLNGAPRSSNKKIDFDSYFAFATK